MTDRRSFLTALAAAPLATLPGRAQAGKVVDIEWIDLIPKGSRGVLWDSVRLSGVIQHGQLSTGFDQEAAQALTDEYDGKTVRLAGFMVPLDFDSKGVTSFILAPFVGACIHVPPPPANQLVLVTSPKPYEYDGLFDPVTVTGPFGISANSTLLAQVGYAMTAERIKPYKF